MFPGYLENRKELGYEALLDTNCGIRLVAITEVITDKTISRLTVSVSNNKKFVPIVFSGIAPLLPESHPVFIRILRSVTVGVIFYYVTKTVFPEKPMVESIPEKPLIDGTKPIPRGEVLDHISKRILQDRAFKVAMIHLHLGTIYLLLKLSSFFRHLKRSRSTKKEHFQKKSRI